MLEKRVSPQAVKQVALSVTRRKGPRGSPYIVDLLDTEVLDILGHPIYVIQSLDELRLDVRDDSITELLSFLGEGFLYEELAKNPAQSTIGEFDARPPSFF